MLGHLGFIWISVEVQKRPDLICEEVANTRPLFIFRSALRGGEQTAGAQTAKEAGTRRPESCLLLLCSSADAVTPEPRGLGPLQEHGFWPSTGIEHTPVQHGELLLRQTMSVRERERKGLKG